MDFIILDPKNRVSRHHLDFILKDNDYFIVDHSKNGTFLNGERVKPLHEVKIQLTDIVMLSGSYPLNLSDILASHDDERTAILHSSRNPDSESRVFLNLGDKTVVFDQNKTRISELSGLDSAGFVMLGRAEECKIRLNNPSISKQHCRIRMLTPLIVEVEDLGSTNGTFADEERLLPNVRQQFSSSVKIRLGSDVNINLAKVFPKIVIPPPVKHSGPVQSKTPQNGLVTKEELQAFNELEVVWKEYQERQMKISSNGMTYSLGGTAAGSILGIALSGAFPLAGAVFGLAGTLAGRYMAQQSATKLKSDLTYEDMFLQVYACPRCGESFQKKPWVTIRDCGKCKVKFK